MQAYHSKEYTIKKEKINDTGKWGKYKTDSIENIESLQSLIALKESKTLIIRKQYYWLI